MKKKYIVTLMEEERQRLQEMLSRGKAAARKLTHARILLIEGRCSARCPGWDDERIAEGLEVGRATVERVRKEFVEEGLEAALERHKPRRQYRRKLDGDGEAHLVALACQKPPEGRGRWTLQLLADRMVELEYVDQISYQTVRRTLKKTRSNRG
jgi:transposase